MKQRILILLLILLLPSAVMAATIEHVEYYFDIDPGFGLGTAVTILSNSEIAPSFNANLTGLATGHHILYVRVKDSDNNWSLSYAHPFYKFELPTSDITEVEYFIDTDPGLGGGTAVAITSGPNITHNFSVSLSSVLNGFHVLYVRVKDANNNWSICQSHPFYKANVQAPPANLVTGEYFIDNDPGLDNGTPINFPPSNSIEVYFMASLSGLSNGAHTLYVRTKDNNGQYSLTHVFPFEADSSAFNVDGDGMNDSWEMTYFGNLFHDGTADTDDDGLTDLEEYQNNTVPTDNDTDGDGIQDGTELGVTLADVGPDTDLNLFIPDADPHHNNRPNQNRH